MGMAVVFFEKLRNNKVLFEKAFYLIKKIMMIEILQKKHTVFCNLDKPNVLV